MATREEVKKFPGVFVLEESRSHTARAPNLTPVVTPDLKACGGP